MSKTHWKNGFNPDFFGAWALNGEDMTVTITGFGTEKVPNKSGKNEEKTVLYLKDQKPLVLNVTNSKAIAALFKTPYLEDWVGGQITLYPTEVRFGADMVDAVRVRPVKPKATLPSIDAARFAKMLESIKAGNYTKEKALASFSFTPEQLKQLQQ